MPELPSKKQPIEVHEVRKIHRLTMRRWIQGILEAFEIDRGAIFTLRRLFANPGDMFLDYLGKNRYHYVPSFRLLVITTAFILLLMNYLGSFNQFMLGMQEGGEDIPDEVIEKVQQVFANYFNLILWLYLPFGALFTQLFNRKQVFNFAEHLVLQAYLLSLANILTVTYSLMSVVPSQLVVGIYFLIVISYNIYAYRVVFNKPLGRSTWEYLLIFVLSYFLYFIAISIVLIGLVFLLLEG